MPEEPNSVWRRSIHEASHLVVAHLHGAEVGGIRLRADSDDCEFTLLSDPEPERKALKHALIALAGLEGEAMGGGAHSDPRQPVEGRQSRAPRATAGVTGRC
jgi:hypothetical protein